MKVYFEPKRMKFYNFLTFLVHKSNKFSHFLPNNKDVNIVTPQFILFYRKGMPHTTKYSQSRKMALFQNKEFQLFSLKFHDFSFKSVHY